MNIMNEVSVDDRQLYRATQWSRHLNKLRWLCLCSVFLALIVLPILSVYQSYVAAHAYDLLSPAEKFLYDGAEIATSWFTDDAETDLDLVKGTTWSANIFGIQISDPLAVAGQVAASHSLYPKFLWTALIPAALSIVFGRFFCGWICPATLIYELNSNLGAWLSRIGFPVGTRRFDRRFKYLVLAAGLVLSVLTGSVMVAAVYPPAIVGRELYYGIALGGFGGGAIFFCLTLLIDISIGRRTFCRYLCPGGALYSLLGRFRLIRIQRKTATCNDCKKCTAVCEFELDPMRDGFGQECNNCTACIAVCPTDALHFELTLSDATYQGPGHLGHTYRRHAGADENSPQTADL